MVHSSDPYLTQQLISYIGNKRALLGPLATVFAELLPERSRRAQVLLDPFCGSGSVARLGRRLGFRVYANDVEEYAWWINSAYLGITAGELASLFRGDGGIDAVVTELNALPPRNGYLSANFAPKDTETADYRTERLFYTTENARRIDAIRTEIERRYPQDTTRLPPFDAVDARPVDAAAREKQLLVAVLLWQASVHANTSGVFKAYHHGFGGFGGDSLGRIRSAVRLHRPVLVDSGGPGWTSCLDAVRFLRERSGDLCYLDPPYNQHQFGSNYHLLNSIARWDRPPVSPSIGDDGRLLDKAGIRRDWTETRSRFCSRRLAGDALRHLLDTVDARFIVLSYGTGGMIPIEPLIDLLADHGQVDVRTIDHAAYRGGRQSPARQTRATELLFVVERPGMQVGSSAGSRLQASTSGGRAAALCQVEKARVASLLRGPLHPTRAAALLGLADGALSIGAGSVRVRHGYRVDEPIHAALLPGDLESVRALGERIEAALCRSPEEEAAVICGILDLPAARQPSVADRRALVRRLLTLLKRLAFRKYRDRFLVLSERLLSCADRLPDRYPGLAAGLTRIGAVAKRRFAA